MSSGWRQSRFMSLVILGEILALLSLNGCSDNTATANLTSAANSHASSYSHVYDYTNTAFPNAIKASDILAMAISGGLVPCPEALGILIVAVGLNRIGLGLSLIAAFSFGVGIVLISIGLLLVRAHALLDRLSKGGRSWQGWLPLVNATIVTLIGTAMVLNSLWKYPMVLGLDFLVMAIVTGAIRAVLRLKRADHQQVNLAARVFQIGSGQTRSKPVSERKF